MRKTAEQASIWGGTVGAQFDPCYHAACDTFANNSNHALDVNADAVGFAMLTFAYSTQSVNGVPGDGCRTGQEQPARPGRPGGHVRPVADIAMGAAGPPAAPRPRITPSG